LFSTVTSAFITDIQQKIKEYFSRTSARLLWLLIQNAIATAFGEHINPPPLLDKSHIGVWYTMYTSLAVSVLAACLAMLGKQGLSRHGQIEMQGHWYNEVGIDRGR
jgi:hypothetical protein